MRRKGQSVLEYTVLFTVVTLVIIYAANNVIQTKAKEQVEAAGDIHEEAVNRLRQSAGLEDGGN